MAKRITELFEFEDTPKLRFEIRASNDEGPKMIIGDASLGRRRELNFDLSTEEMRAIAKYFNKTANEIESDKDYLNEQNDRGSI